MRRIVNEIAARMRRHPDRHARDSQNPPRAEACDRDSGAVGRTQPQLGGESENGDTEQVVEPDLQWHPSLYAGSARYYAIGRVSYPTALADALASELGLDGSGRLLDVGCGPGNFTLLLAPWFEQALGVDADRDMLAEAERRAAQAGIANVHWLQLRAEELPAGLGRYRVVSFAQSFHWMDQLQVARVALSMLEAGGACVHIHANTHEGVDTDAVLPHPRPPRVGDQRARRALPRADRA